MRRQLSNWGATKMSHTHQTAPPQFVDTAGVRFAYRRFGKSGGVPLVFNQHFTGTMDHWDPAVIDGFTKDREVILFNNAGVSSSSGEVPTTFEEMGGNAVAFIKALGLSKLDVLGFSIGGFVAQEITLQAPDLVRRLVLVGTGPRSGEGMATLTPEAQEIFGATYDEPDHLWLRTSEGGSFVTPALAPGVRACATDPTRPSAGRRDASGQSRAAGVLRLPP
jgi:pimeloyl-ACP methyl ester carboxylesterase